MNLIGFVKSSPCPRQNLSSTYYLPVPSTSLKLILDLIYLGPIFTPFVLRQFQILEGLSVDGKSTQQSGLFDGARGLAVINASKPNEMTNKTMIGAVEKQQ